MPELDRSRLAATPGRIVRITQARDDEVLLDCPVEGCSWTVLRPNRERVVWSAREAHRIAHERGLVQ